jgi:hypothetical protein
MRLACGGGAGTLAQGRVDVEATTATNEVFPSASVTDRRRLQTGAYAHHAVASWTV